MSEKQSKQLKYYHANKDKINEKNRNSGRVCECGSSIPKGHAKRHYATKKHLNFIEAKDLFYSHYDGKPVQTSDNSEEKNKKN